MVSTSTELVVIKEVRRRPHLLGARSGKTGEVGLDSSKGRKLRFKIGKIRRNTEKEQEVPTGNRVNGSCTKGGGFGGIGPIEKETKDRTSSLVKETFRKVLGTSDSILGRRHINTTERKDNY